ncbi:MAG: putative DNA-binding domain-containing protein [Halieaceae bacterium]|nr:putative DNA-binding domain-containing protein [Halieaceae bacterium]
MSANSNLKAQQMEMASFLRDPEHNAPPAGIEARRLKIYQDLVYNNIEGFINSGFPVLKSLYDDSDWHALVRRFIDGHRCHTPYFLEISQEFLHFLTEDYEPRDCDPPFMAELAHYEWVELGLDVAEEEIPQDCPEADVLSLVPRLSPVAWVLAYQWPVHEIGPGHRPSQSEQPTFLAVYRDREDKVRFMALNPAMARLLELVRDNEGELATALVAQLAAELSTTNEAIAQFASQELNQLRSSGIIYCEPKS